MLSTLSTPESVPGSWSWSESELPTLVSSQSWIEQYFYFDILIFCLVFRLDSAGAYSFGCIYLRP